MTKAKLEASVKGTGQPGKMQRFVRNAREKAAYFRSVGQRRKARRIMAKLHKIARGL